MNTHPLLRVAFIALLSCMASRVEAVLPNDSVDTYTNHTVTDSVYVQGRSVLTISDVGVPSGGHLVASSPNGIVISGGLVVELGGRLNLYEKRTRYVLFTHDGSGNITSRKNKWQAQ